MLTEIRDDQKTDHDVDEKNGLSTEKYTLL